MTTEQDQQLQRVSDAVSSIVIEFCRRLIATGAPQFRMAELTAYVLRRCPVAPDSPGRILRALNARGAISYTLVSRAGSLYSVIAVREAA